MSKKNPSGAEITHNLAALGNGVKKDGGGGMIGGIENLAHENFKRGKLQQDLENQYKSGLKPAVEIHPKTTL